MPAQPERTKRLIRELKKLDPAVPLNQPATAKALGYQSAMRLQHYRRDHPGYLPEPDVVEELGTPEDPACADPGTRPPSSPSSGRTTAGPASLLRRQKRPSGW